MLERDFTFRSEPDLGKYRFSWSVTFYEIFKRLPVIGFGVISSIALVWLFKWLGIISTESNLYHLSTDSEVLYKAVALFPLLFGVVYFCKEVFNLTFRRSLELEKESLRAVEEWAKGEVSEFLDWYADLDLYTYQDKFNTYEEFSESEAEHNRKHLFSSFLAQAYMSYLRKGSGVQKFSNRLFVKEGDKLIDTDTFVPVDFVVCSKEQWKVRMYRDDIEEQFLTKFGSSF